MDEMIFVVLPSNRATRTSERPVSFLSLSAQAFKHCSCTQTRVYIYIKNCRKIKYYLDKTRQFYKNKPNKRRNKCAIHTNWHKVELYHRIFHWLCCVKIFATKYKQFKNNRKQLYWHVCRSTSNSTTGWKGSLWKFNFSKQFSLIISMVMLLSPT